jgi:hypothetical protein
MIDQIKLQSKQGMYDCCKNNDTYILLLLESNLANMYKQKHKLSNIPIH